MDGDINLAAAEEEEEEEVRRLASSKSQHSLVTMGAVGLAAALHRAETVWERRERKGLKSGEMGGRIWDLQVGPTFFFFYYDAM